MWFRVVLISQSARGWTFKIQCQKRYPCLGINWSGRRGCSHYRVDAVQLFNCCTWWWSMLVVLFILPFSWIDHICVGACRCTFSGYIRGYEKELAYNRNNREVLKLANIVVQLLNFLQLQFTLSLFLVSQISVVINVLKKHLGLM